MIGVLKAVFCTPLDRMQIAFGAGVLSGCVALDVLRAVFA